MSDDCLNSALKLCFYCFSSRLLVLCLLKPAPHDSILPMSVNMFLVCSQLYSSSGARTALLKATMLFFFLLWQLELVQLFWRDMTFTNQLAAYKRSGVQCGPGFVREKKCVIHDYQLLRYSNIGHFHGATLHLHIRPDCKSDRSCRYALVRHITNPIHSFKMVL